DGDEDDDGQVDREFDGTDCDDGDPDAFLGAATEEASLCTRDLDGDGYGDATATAPLEAGTDCDDANPDGFPGAASAEPELCTQDDDRDGYGDRAASAPLDAGTDCDDADAFVYVGAAAAEPELCTLDGDGDGYGTPDALAPVEVGTDCDDSDAALNPADVDADGYSTCEDDCDDADDTLDPSDSDGDGYTSCAGDCDDSSFTTAPGAAEAEDPVACMTDADGDGYGDASATVGTVGTDCNDGDYYTFPGSAPNDDAAACMTDRDGDDWGSDAPSSGADVGTDCDDSLIRAFPGAAPNDDATACMKDQDTDDWGDDSFENPGTDCDDGNFTLTPADSDSDGYSSCDGDCDDTDDTLLPEDNDLDGYTSCDGDCNDADASLNLDDLDGDGYATCDDDCDDNNVDIRPGLVDMPLIDVDCDGTYGSASLGDAHAIYSTTALTHLGSHVETAGDWDGDGLDDMLIAARGDGLTLPGEVHLVTAADWAAQSYVSSTAVLRATTLRAASATLTFVGENSGDLAGHSAASAADVDNDGLLDFLIGAPANRDVDYGSGKVYLVLGASIGSSTTIPLSSADYSFTGEGWYDYAGRFVTFANVDADPYDDVLVGAYAEDLAYLIRGASLGATAAWSLADADVVFEGGQSGERTGYELRNAGDLDGDGQDDIIMSAHLFRHSGGTGKAMVMLADGLAGVTNYSTADADYAWLAEDINDYAGVSVDGAGDVDGDGADDLIIGAKGSDTAGTDAGKAYLVLNSSFSAGTVNVSTADYIFLGADIQESVGTQVRGAGDVDADGLADILIGGDSVPGTAAGGAYVIPGADLGGAATIDLSTVDHYFAGEVNDDEAGSFLGPAGDVDGDGRSDLLVGAHAHSDVANRAGKVYLLLSDL
ncbi:MAG TPA: hypothetical protein DFR83_08485, partial [Deltaproteobacteria bacterium]|nr:hypothetical protein [Deltaproteobacteria bacterium]